MGFSTFIRSSNLYHYLLQNIFISPKRNPMSICHSHYLDCSPNPWQPLIYFMSLKIYLFFSFLLFFFGCICGMQKSPGQGSNPRHSSNPSKPLQWWCQILNLLSQRELQIYLFWTFHITRMIPYMAFCVWFPSFSMMFSRVLVLCISISFLLMAE